MKSISTILLTVLAVGIGLSALFGMKSIPIWLFVIAIILFSGNKNKK